VKLRAIGLQECTDINQGYQQSNWKISKTMGNHGPPDHDAESQSVFGWIRYCTDIYKVDGTQLCVGYFGTIV
jgi:hypothetical protein